MKKYNVLLVDDVLLNRRILKAALSVVSELDFFEASDGFSALEILKSKAIDLIILDLIMPGKSGHEVMNELSTIAGYRDIPIIVYSAVSDEAVIKDIRDKGVFDYLVKPLNGEHLRSLLPNKVMSALKLRDMVCKLSAEEEASPAGRQASCLKNDEIVKKQHITDRITELEHTLKQVKDMSKEELVELLQEVLFDKLKEEQNKLAELRG